ncbi:MAG: hypothetical protein Unbinned8138contig1000_27 [Prokaryotic dsDNA virus sp.]|nr:MAG: hypothetical protein Unbinned8138contig1000_27 [Prokaryotic dsDNA virus sp.]|tara:strand:+ start:752 stop:880 length:129 start_codon:yes stop_codon:yes gene_type:complete
MSKDQNEALKELKRADEARDNTFDSWIVDLEEEEENSEDSES